MNQQNSNQISIMRDGPVAAALTAAFAWQFNRSLAEEAAGAAREVK